MLEICYGSLRPMVLTMVHSILRIHAIHVHMAINMDSKKGLAVIATLSISTMHVVNTTNWSHAL